jgi:sugar phosphate isomerase/epimerase
MLASRLPTSARVPRQAALQPGVSGDVPVRESLAALCAAGYDGLLTVEWEKRWHPELAEPEVALPRERETLKRWLG